MHFCVSIIQEGTIYIRKKKIEMQHVKCWSHVSWAELKDPRNVPYAQKCYFFQMFVYIPVSDHFSYANIIHPPDRWSISRSWLNSMIITQVHLVLVAIKGSSKMCSFVTQHNATDVSGFEGASNWHADCRNVHQSCCQRLECLFLYHKPLTTLF